jgi:hypothetical protein
MKHQILLLLITTLSISLFGQSYIPFEMSVGTYWRNSSYNCCFNAGAQACIAEHYSEVTKDTIIAGKTYHKIRKGYISNNGSANCMGSNYSVVHYLREDTLLKKIYERIWTGQDTVIMDFSQQIGDTCNLFYYNYASAFVVTGIDSILINGVYHKRIIYGGGQFSLIEGVGCTLGITELWNDFENSTELTCKGNNGLTQYPDTTSNPNSCIPVLNLGLQNIDKEQLMVSVFPNPSKSLITCSIQGKKIYSVKLFDLVGNVLLVKEFRTSAAIVDISHILNGIYGLTILDEDGNKYYEHILKE